MTGLVAFVSGYGPGQVPYVHTAMADGTGITKIAQGDQPAWSSDGRRLAFHRDGDIYVVRADGSDERRLAKGKNPTWSPDGQRIAFDGDTGIFAVRLDGDGPPDRLVGDGTTLPRGDWHVPTGDDAGWVEQPAWSPDGRKIAFVRFEADSGDWLYGPREANVYIINADGSDPRLLTRICEIETPGIGGDRCYSRSPAWSPDGKQIAVVTASTVATIRLGGPETWQGHVFRHRQPPYAVSGLTWSADGRYILFGGRPTDRDRRELYVLRLADGAIRPFFPPGSVGATLDTGDPVWLDRPVEP